MMVAYSFKARFARPILDGTKIHTIRADRNGRSSRHARPGEALQLYTGMRTISCRKIADKICVAALAIALDFDDDEAWIEDDFVGMFPFCPPFRTNGHRMQLSEPRFYGAGIDVEMLARADGFSSWDEMSGFLREAHGDSFFVGKLIGWWPA